MPVLWWLLACGPKSENACPTSNNGSCDEMLTCAIGTDSKDCDEACAEWNPSDNDWRMAGVCALDEGNALVEWEKNPGVGSNGSGGLVGSYDDIVTVRGSRLSDVVDRQYRVYVPRRYSEDRPTPVLFALVDLRWTCTGWLSSRTEPHGRQRELHRGLWTSRVERFWLL